MEFPHLLFASLLFADSFYLIIPNFIFNFFLCFTRILPFSDIIAVKCKQEQHFIHPTKSQTFVCENPT